jgi:hypothetical protein
MLRRVALVRIDVSEEVRASVISSSETSVLTSSTGRNIPEDCILHEINVQNRSLPEMLIAAAANINVLAIIPAGSCGCSYDIVREVALHLPKTKFHC